MNATTAEQVAEVEVDYQPPVTENAEVRLDELAGKLHGIKNIDIRNLLDKQAELIERLNGLSNLEDIAEAARTQAIIEADLESVREQIAMRTENVGEMAAELMALYDELGLQSQKADADAPEDQERRDAAEKLVQDAMTAIATAEAAVTTATTKVTEAENSWWPFGKDTKIQNAKTAKSKREGEVTEAKILLTQAKTNVDEVEKQIEIDKATRIRNASLTENFALIREFTQNAVRTLTEDINETETRKTITEKALTSALTKRSEVTRDLDATRDDLEKMDRDLNRERAALDEIPDQGSEAYAVQHKHVVDLETKMTELRGKELKLNTQQISLVAAIEANKSSLQGITTQRDTAEVHLIKLETAEKTAAILGHNIDRMIKNSTQESASDSLDRASDKMILTSVEMGIQAEVASGKARNDAIERHDKLMKNISLVRETGDKAQAIQAERYLKLDEKIRKGYKDRGIDIDAGHLFAAAQSIGVKKESSADPSEGDVAY